MKTVLDDLYEGNIFPREQLVPDYPEYRETMLALSEAFKRLKAMQGVEGVELLQKIDEQTTMLEGLHTKFFFIAGFKLGMKLMCEACSTDPSLSLRMTKE